MEENIKKILIPQSWLNDLLAKMEAMEAALTKRQEDTVNHQWIDSTQARKMLNISPKTWQIYRKERRIPFSQFGRKIYVKKADLEEFMQQHYIYAKDKKGGNA